VPRVLAVSLFLWLASLPSAVRANDPGFLGEPDAPRIAALRNGAIKEVSKGKGGRSLAFRITLEDGTKGYFKPRQSFSAAHWYSEVAAYYLDRELGIGRVPPTTGRRFDWAALKKAAGNDDRVSELRIAKDGTIQGAFERFRSRRISDRWTIAPTSAASPVFARPPTRADRSPRTPIRRRGPASSPT
jgi:hypothetical protein